MLAKFDLFASLNDRARRAIATQVYERTFEQGETIAVANEPCSAVYLVIRGEVRTCRLSAGGREYVLDDLGPGQFFNLASALDGRRNLATVTTSTEATVYAIECEVFRQIVRDHPVVAMGVLAHMAGQVRHLSNTVEDLALHSVRARLARCLLSSSNSSAPAIKKQWTQEEIAMHIGTVRDVVGRTLRAFSREGIVRRERGRLVVTDLAALRRVAMCE